MKGLPRPLTVALLLALAGSVLFSQASRAQSTSVMTDPVGYNLLTLPAGNSVRVNTFVQAKSFQGTMASVTGGSNSVITVSGSGTMLTSGSFSQTAAEPSYYVEVLATGSAQGLIADVISNDGSTITVSGNLAVYGLGSGASFCVRPHTTLASLFTSSSGLVANVDSVKLFYPNNTSRSFTFTGTGSGWGDSGTNADSGNEVIYPGEGFIINVATPETVSITGSVKVGPTQIAVYAGAINVVGSFNCNVGGTQALGDFNFPASFAANVDSAKLFTDDGSLNSPGSYLSDGTQMVDAGTNAPSNTAAVAPSNAVIVTVAQNKNLVIPSFYTSGQ